MAINIATAISNNIELHYITRLMNIFQPYGISKKEFNKIKNLILCNKMDEIPADYKLWSESIKRDYLPAEFNKSYAYDVKGATRDNVVYPSYDPCIFEVKYPKQDIQGRVINI